MFPQREKLPHRTPPWVDASAVFFITICSQPRGINQLAHPQIAHEFFESVAFRMQRGDWYAHLVLLMPDHLHALISFPREADMKRVVSNWKEIVAKKTGVRWQRDFFDHRLRAQENFEETAHYIRQNSVRAGLVADADRWAFIWPSQNGGPSGPALPS